MEFYSPVCTTATTVDVTGTPDVLRASTSTALQHDQQLTSDPQLSSSAQQSMIAQQATTSQTTVASQESAATHEVTAPHISVGAPKSIPPQEPLATQESTVPQTFSASQQFTAPQPGCVPQQPPPCSASSVCVSVQKPQKPQLVSSTSAQKRPVEGSADNSLPDCVMNEYSGYQPTVGITQLTERVMADMEPSQFFSEYIKQRRPAVIKGLADLQWKGDMVWTLGYLFNKAGSTKVTVEDKYTVGANKPTFEMRYRDFMSAMIAGETRYHLVTRDEQSSNTGLRYRNVAQNTVVQPLQLLSADFPLRPAIAGNLVLHQVALCQGRAGVTGSDSSELQHFFHDTLHVVIHGRRRFHLFPPSAISMLQMTSCPLRIHPNGLVVYLPMQRSKQRAADVRSDGAPLIAIARQKRADAEKDLISAETQLDQLRQSSEADNKVELKEELSRAMKAVRDCERLVDIATDELDRYYSDYEEDVISIHDDDSEPEASDEPPTKVQKLSDDDQDCVKAVDNSKAVDKETEVVKTDKLLCGIYQDVKLSVSASANGTSSGSAANAAAADNPDVLFTQCPQLKSVGCLVTDLAPGEVLYLPASWLCQITTWNDEHIMQPKQTMATTVPTAVESVEAGSSLMESIEAGSSVVVKQPTNDNVNSDNVSVTTETTMSSKDIEATDALAKSSTDHIKATETVPSGSDVGVGDNQGSEMATSCKVSDVTTVAGEGDIAMKVVTESIAEEAGTKSQQQAVGMTSRATSSSGQSLGYLALNYWFHPPDNETFSQPYQHDFWSRRWQKVEVDVKRALKKSARNVSDVISLDSDSSSQAGSDDYSESSEYDEGSSGEFDSDPDSTPVFLSQKPSCSGSTSGQPAAMCSGVQAQYQPVAAIAGLKPSTQALLDNCAGAILVGDDSESDDESDNESEEDSENEDEDGIADVEWDTAVTGARCYDTSLTTLRGSQLGPSSSHHLNTSRDDVIIMDDDDDVIACSSGSQTSGGRARFTDASANKFCGLPLPPRSTSLNVASGTNVAWSSASASSACHLEAEAAVHNGRKELAPEQQQQDTISSAADVGAAGDGKSVETGLASTDV